MSGVRQAMIREIAWCLVWLPLCWACSSRPAQAAWQHKRAERSHALQARKGAALQWQNCVGHRREEQWDAWWPEWSCASLQRLPWDLFGDGAKWMCAFDVVGGGRGGGHRGAPLG